MFNRVGQLVVAVVCCLVLASCGGSEEDSAGEAAENYAEAFVDGDMERACELMTGESKRALLKVAMALGNNCEKLMQAYRDSLDKGELREFDDFEVVSVTVDGDSAQVKDNSGDTNALRKVDGEWLLEFNSQ